MTITIELTPEQQTRLAAFARRQGLAPTELAQRLVTEHLPEIAADGGRGGTAALPGDMDRSHFYFTATSAEWEAAMDQLAAGGEELPALPDEAYDRENLYEDRL